MAVFQFKNLSPPPSPPPRLIPAPMSRLLLSCKYNCATSSQTKISSISSNWFKDNLEHNFKKLAWCTLPSILEPEKVHFCPSVSTQGPFSKVTAKAQPGICSEWASLGTRACMSTDFVFRLSPGASQMQNLRQVPLTMACNMSWLLPCDLGSA